MRAMGRGCQGPERFGIPEISPCLENSFFGLAQQAFSSSKPLCVAGVGWKSDLFVSGRWANPIGSSFKPKWWPDIHLPHRALSRRGRLS